MDIVQKLKGLLVRKPPKPADTELIYVYLPGSVEPIDRGALFEDPLNEELQLKGLGEVSGGGTQLGEEKADGSCDIEFCGIDVDTTDVSGARELLREQLVLLGCPPGTQLHYREGGRPLQDAYDGRTWALGGPRDLMHPGFGI